LKKINNIGKLQIAPDFDIPKDQQPEIIIFDFDGVCLDSQAAFNEVFARVFELSNVPYGGLVELQEVFDTGMWEGLTTKGVKINKDYFFDILIPRLDGFSPRNAYYVGDTVGDMIDAHKAGVHIN